MREVFVQHSEEITTPHFALTCRHEGEWWITFPPS